jgi:hypothetical protein
MKEKGLTIEEYMSILIMKAKGKGVENDKQAYENS